MGISEMFNGLPATAKNTIVSAIIFLIIWAVITIALLLVGFGFSTSAIIGIGGGIIVSGHGWLRVNKKI